MPDFTASIASKLPRVGASIFAVMSRLALEHDAINLAQGFPDFPVSPELIDLVHAQMKSGHNQYAPMPGILPLREVIGQFTKEHYHADYHPDTEITVTAGATQGLFTAITALVRAGDEVIIFEPAYDSYLPAIELNGGKIITIRMKYPDYAIDWDEVHSKITHRTRLIILNSPHNPSGTLLNQADLDRLENLVVNTDIIILSDEVYEHIVFDGRKHRSVAGNTGLRERSIIFSSFGKTYHATGWKMGYVLAPKYLMDEFRRVHQFVVFCVNTPIQYALAEYLQIKENYLSLVAFYQRKRDFFIDKMKGSRFDIVPAQGTYFQLANYRRISAEHDRDFASLLTREFKVASIPVSVFYHDLHDEFVLRFCFAKKDETLSRVAAILCRL
jgi:methionine aminotransferase